MMIELWQVISLALTVLGLLIGFGKVLLAQIDKRLEQRFGAVERDLQRGRDVEREFERELLQLKADLPLHYVRREDYVRNQTIIEAKLDALALKLENIQLQGNRSTP